MSVGYYFVVDEKLLDILFNFGIVNFIFVMFLVRFFLRYNWNGVIDDWNFFFIIVYNNRLG